MKVKMGNPSILWDSDLCKDIEKVIKSGWVSIGDNVEQLEGHFIEEFGVKHAIATNCATTGLIIAIKAAGWKNRNVHIPAFTWPSTAYAVECNNNTVICRDIDRDTWLMKHFIDYPLNGDCVIPVDIFGSKANVYSAFPIENRIYDAAHSYGIEGLGHRGIAEVVSLSFTKVITAMEGGMILTNDDKLADTARELRRLSGRMGEINALVALQSIERYKITTDRRQDVVGKYIHGINIPYDTQLINTTTNYSVFSMLFKETTTRNSVMKALTENGVETKVYYDPLFPGLQNTDYVYNRILSLPTHSGINPSDVKKIIKIINESAETTPGKNYLIDGWGK
jgi:dTDP-4-amino-4,6-dideoxygalactose transaminase